MREGHKGQPESQVFETFHRACSFLWSSCCSYKLWWVAFVTPRETQLKSDPINFFNEEQSN